MQSSLAAKGWRWASHTHTDIEVAAKKKNNVLFCSSICTSYCYCGTCANRLCRYCSNRLVLLWFRWCDPSSRPRTQRGLAGGEGAQRTREANHWMEPVCRQYEHFLIAKVDQVRHQFSLEKLRGHLLWEWNCWKHTQTHSLCSPIGSVVVNIERS